MKLDDPNHDPQDPMVCKPDEIGDKKLPLLRVKEMINDLREHVKYSTLESYLRYKGWTDDLKIHREILKWKESYQGESED